MLAECYYTVKDKDGHLYLNTVLYHDPDLVWEQLSESLDYYLTDEELKEKYTLVKLKITEI